MAGRSCDDPHSASVKDLAVQISSLRVNGSIIKRRASKEQHAMPLTYSRLRSISDHQQQKPRRKQTSSHTAPHGKGTSLRTTRHSTKVLKKAASVGEGVGNVRMVTRVGAVKEQSRERIIRSSFSESSSGCDSPSVQVEVRKIRYRIPKRLNGVGKDREACESVLHCNAATGRSQSFDATEPCCDFDTLTLYDSVSPLAKVTARLRSEVLRSEDDDSVDSWSSSMERQPGDGCVDETSVTWSDEDILSNLSAEEDGDDLGTSSIHLDDDLCDAPILPEIPLCSPLKRKQYLASCTPSKLASSPGSSKVTSHEALAGCKIKLLVDHRLPKRSQSLTFPADNAHGSTVPLQSDEFLVAKATEKEAISPLATSLFPNVSPSIYFPLIDEQCMCVNNKHRQLRHLFNGLSMFIILDTPFPYEIRRLLKWKMSTITPNIIKQCIARVGFTRAKSECSLSSE